MDLAEFTDLLSQAWGVGTGVSAAQYLKWSDDVGLLTAIARGGPLEYRDLCNATSLNADGVDSLMPILMALGIVQGCSGGYTLTQVGEEYFLPERCYFVGHGLFWGCEEPIPEAYLRVKMSGKTPVFQPPAASQLLKIQLSRNLAPSVCAVRSGRFEGVRHLVDIGGGAGAIAIPFALDHPEARVTLVDLGSKCEDIQTTLEAYCVERQVSIRPMDVFAQPWYFGDCDGMVFGNFFHAFDDDRCRQLLRRCAACLLPRGRIWIHEVLFDEGKAGPLVAALWNANMHVIGGRQRTASEFTTFLNNAGFGEWHISPTAGRFSLIDAVRR